MSRWPWLTLALAVVVVAVHAVPGAPELLALDRGAPAELWRWLTGHLTHFSWDHLAWDLGVAVVLGAWLERRDRARLAGLWLAGSVAIAAAFWWATPELSSYRGLSGLDAALYAAVAVELWRSSAGRERWAALALALTLAGKVVYEVATGHTLFADDTGWTPVPLAHAVGGLVGLLAWSWPQRSRDPGTSTPKACSVATT